MNGSLQLCQLTRGYNSALILRWSRRSQGYKCFSLRHKTPSILGRNKSPALANTMKKTQSVHGLLQFEPFQPVQHSPLVKFAAKAAGLVEKWVAAVRFAQVLRADRGQPMDWFLGTPQKTKGGVDGKFLSTNPVMTGVPTREKILGSNALNHPIIYGKLNYYYLFFRFLT